MCCPGCPAPTGQQDRASWFAKHSSALMDGSIGQKQPTGMLIILCRLLTGRCVDSAGISIEGGVKIREPGAFQLSRRHRKLLPTNHRRTNVPCGSIDRNIISIAHQTTQDSEDHCLLFYRSMYLGSVNSNNKLLKRLATGFLNQIDLVHVFLMPTDDLLRFFRDVESWR